MSHAFLQQYIGEHGQDYRFESAPHPVEALQDRAKDNVSVGRMGKAK